MITLATVWDHFLETGVHTSPSGRTANYIAAMCMKKNVSFSCRYIEQFNVWLVFKLPAAKSIACRRDPIDGALYATDNFGGILHTANTNEFFICESTSKITASLICKSLGLVDVTKGDN